MSSAKSTFIYIIFVLLTGIAFVTTEAYGQSLSSGIDFEYRLGFYLTAADHTPNVVNPGVGDVTGNSLDQTFRLAYSHDLVSLFGDNLTLSASLGLSQSLGSFTSTPISLSYSGTFLHAAVTARHPFRNLEIGLGGWLSAPLTQTMTETPQLASRSILYSQWPVGVQLSVAGTHSYFGDLPIYPALFGEFDFSAYRQPNVSFVGALTGGLRFEWKFLGKESSTEQVAAQSPNVSVPRVPESTPSTETMRADIHFTALGHTLASGESVPIETRDTLIREYSMLPTTLQLSSNRLSPSYHLLHASEAESFTTDSLARMDERGIASNLLNIYGSRMRASPDFSVVLEYGKNGDAAANWLLRYFRDVFWVSGTHVSLKKQEILMDHIQITPTEPVAIQWIERSYALGEFGLEHSVESNHGIRSWYVDLKQGNDAISHLTSVGASSGTEIALTDLHAHAASAIVARFVAEDSSGNQAEAFDTLHLAVQQSENHSAPTRYRYIFLIDSSRIDEIDRLLVKLKESLTKNVTIEYYFGSEGMPAWLRKKLGSVSGTESLHPLSSDDLVGPRAVVTVLKE
jgi:hypothetical protein